MSSKYFSDIYSIANAFTKIGSNFLQIQTKNIEWFYKTSNWRCSIKYQHSHPYPHSHPHPSSSQNIPPELEKVTNSIKPLEVSSNIKLSSEIINDKPNIHKEPINETKENIQWNVLKESKIPVSRVSRLFHYGGRFRNSLNLYNSYHKFI